MGKKLIQEEFEQSVYKIHGDKISVIGKYDGLDRPISIKCNVSGEIKSVKLARSVYSKSFSCCTKCTKQKQIDTYVNDLYINKYPYKYDDITTFYLDNVEYDPINTEYIVTIHDNFGYKYSMPHNRIYNRQNQNTNFNKFFGGNKFTFNNINVFLKLNNIPLELVQEDIDKFGARDKLKFIDIDGNIKLISWNYIQTDTYRYKEDYQETLKRNKESRMMTKEKAIPIIREMENKLKRPLLQSDFENIRTSKNSVGIRVVWRLFGTFNNMIDELGLKKHDFYFKPNSKFYKPHKEYLQIIRDVCDYVKLEGRNIVTYKDFKLIRPDAEINTIRSHCRLENISLNDYVKKFGCELQNAGNGMNHIFTDGEKVVSQYEYEFSSYLRSLGLIYNKNYFRDVLYKKLDEEYKGSMNCDYQIIINSHSFYIELAGILCNKEHEKSYKNNLPINSKSKEKYRLNLNQKREIFERNNLDYYILLPSEMNENNYKKILQNYLVK